MERMMDYMDGWYDTHPAYEYDRRGLSGIYIFDKFPEEGKVEPTCLEDCDPMKQEEYVKSLPPETVIKLVLMLSRALKDVGKNLNIESSEDGEFTTEEKGDSLEEEGEIPQG